MSRSTYTISTTKKEDRVKYGILITQRDGTTGWIVGNDGDGLFFDERGQAVKRLKELKADDRYTWNCEAEVMLFPGWGKG